MAVDPGYGEYLKSPARFVGATISGAAGLWGDQAIDSRLVSPLAFRDDAQTEVIRQAQFLAGPLARDRVVVLGLWASLIGKPVAISGDRAGYEQSPVVFVLGADENEAARYTVLTVLKRL